MGLVGAWWRTPRVRRRIARVVVVLGALIVLAALVGGRWGWLFAGIVVAGLGAAMGPARIRRNGGEH